MQDWLSWQLTVWKSQRSMQQKISCAPFWDFRPVENSQNWLQHTAIPYVPKVCSDRWEFMTVHLILPELSLHQSGTLISGWVSPTSLQTHPLNRNLSGFEPKSCFVSVNTIARICGNNIVCLLSRRDGIFSECAWKTYEMKHVDAAVDENSFLICWLIQVFSF